MHIWYRRPLFCVCACLMLGVTVAFRMHTAAITGIWAYVLPVAVAVAVTVGAWLLCRAYRPDTVRTVLCVGGLCVSLCIALLMGGLALRAQVRPDSLGTDPALSDETEQPEWHVTGEVRAVLLSGNQQTVYGMAADSINGSPVSCMAVLSCAYTGNLTPGCRIEATLRAATLGEAAGELGRTLIGDGYSVGLLSENERDITVLSETDAGWRVRTDSLRRRLSAALQLSVGEAGRGLPSAMLFGERGYIPDEVRRDFERSGVSHLLAISGLHMTLLFGLWAVLLKWLTVPRRLRALLSGLAAVGYLWLLGFPPSATRAVIMLGAVYLSWLWGAVPDPLTALGLAGAVILLCQPWAVADTGFWMSFSAALGLLTVMPVVAEYLRGRRLPRDVGLGRRLLWRIRRGAVWVVSGLATGVAAMSCSLWITAPVFGSVSLWSPPATLLFTPLCAVLIVLSLLALPFGGSWLGQTVLLPLMRSVCRGMSGLASRMSDSPYAVLSLRSDAAACIIPVMTVSLLLLLCIKLPARRRWMLFLPILCGWVLLAGSAGLTADMQRDSVTVTACATSSQSEAVILTRGQAAVILDLSDGSLTAMQTATRQARAQGATELSALVLTHYHSRMPGTLDRVLRREKVRALYLPVPETEDEYYLMTQVLSQAEAAGVRCCLYTAGDTEGGGDVLTPTDGLTLSLYRTWLSRSVQPVLMLWLETVHDSLLWCGGAVAESDLSDTADALMQQADTVLFCTHGPLYKQAYALPAGCTASVVCFGDETSAAWFDVSSLPDSCPVLIVGGYRGEMRWNDKGLP